MDGVEQLQLEVVAPVPKLPAYKRKQEIDVRYAVIPPYAYIHIYWDPVKRELIYEVEEPQLDEEEKEVLDVLEKGIEEVIDVSFLKEKTRETVINYLKKSSYLILRELNLNITTESYFKIFYYLYRNFIGLNEIEPMMKDFFTEDISCNGIDSPLYVVHRLYRNMRTNLIFRDVGKLGNFVEKLAQRSGRYVSYASPILDGTLPDGSRVNATYTTDITSKGPTFTIRKFTKIPFTPIQLIKLKTLTPEALAYFWLLIEYKSNILITGGTSSGKTTLLNAIAFFIPPEARVVSIEDTRELNLPRENWLPSVSRTGLGVGKIGEVSLFDLLKGSFRQNPDYVIVGEVRGKEAYVLFQGMASGHPSLSSIHADSVDTVIKRLQTPPISLSPTLVNTLDVVAVMAHAIAGKKETRKLREIIEVVSVDPEGVAITDTHFFWNPADDSFYFKKESHVFKKIMKRYGLSQQELLKEFALRTKLLYTLYSKNIADFSTVQEVINMYYKNPIATLERFGIR